MHHEPLPAPPDFLTVEEAAAVLRIGRTVAYRLARQYLAAGDGDLPCERFGKLMRVPRVLLELKLGGPITWPIPTAAPTNETPRPLRPPVLAERATTARRTPRPQNVLPLFE
ncbi:MAG: helix-turn-helix domain-containing protein [Ilumatobacteraceae bacterium]|nr:helix-turn-helix domain-containing protein [Ilumatobacteraceae bacterium]